MMNARIRKVNGGDVLEVQVPVCKTVSKSSKTILIASTHGPVPVPVQVDGYNLVVNVNAYIPNQTGGTDAQAPPKKLVQKS
jgi:hypothetical protein